MAEARGRDKAYAEGYAEEGGEEGYEVCSLADWILIHDNQCYSYKYFNISNNPFKIINDAFHIFSRTAFLETHLCKE